MAEIIHKLFGPKHSKHGDDKGSGKGSDGEGYTKQQHDFCEYTSCTFRGRAKRCVVY